MKKTASRILALALMASLILSGCGSTGTGENTQANNEKPASGESSAEKPEGESIVQGEPITDLVISKIATSELSTFNLLNSETSADSQYLTNLWDGLLDVLLPCHKGNLKIFLSKARKARIVRQGHHFGE